MPSSTRNLTDVPEEDGKSQNSSPSPYSSTTPTASSSNLSVNGHHRTARKASSVRTLGKSSNDQLPSASGSSVKRSSSNSASSTSVVTTKTPRSMISHSQIPVPKFRATPRLPHEMDVESVPSTIMYWSRAPVWGTVPTRTMRAHTVTLVDTTIWLFGGCDDKDNSRDIYCFDIGM